MSTTVGGKVRSNDGTAIAFSRLGNGRPIISVDGAVAHRSFNAAGAELASLLAPRFTVVTYDRRGRGESGDTPPYAPAREVEDLEALIAEVGGSAFVVAMSSGCATALDAAARDIGIEKLALYEPSFIVGGSRPAMPTDYVARLKSLVASGRRRGRTLHDGSRRHARGGGRPDAECSDVAGDGGGCPHDRVRRRDPR